MTTTAEFQRALTRSVQRADGWANALTGIGNALRDKSLATTMFADQISRQQTEAIWQGDDMGARIVEIVPHEMLREGFEVCIQDDDAGAAEGITKRLEELDVHSVFQDALQYERAY